MGTIARARHMLSRSLVAVGRIATLAEEIEAVAMTAVMTGATTAAMTAAMTVAMTAAMIAGTTGMTAVMTAGMTIADVTTAIRGCHTAFLRRKLHVASS